MSSKISQMSLRSIEHSAGINEICRAIMENMIQEEYDVGMEDSHADFKMASGSVLKMIKNSGAEIANRAKYQIPSGNGIGDNNNSNSWGDIDDDTVDNNGIDQRKSRGSKAVNDNSCNNNIHSNNNNNNNNNNESHNRDCSSPLNETALYLQLNATNPSPLLKERNRTRAKSNVTISRTCILL